MSPSRRFFTSGEKRPQRPARPVVRESRDLGLFDQGAERCEFPLRQLSAKFTVKQLAAKLGCSIDSIYWDIAHHDLPTCRRGLGPRARILIDEAEYEQWLRRQREDEDEPALLRMVGGHR